MSQAGSTIRPPRRGVRMTFLRLFAAAWGVTVLAVALSFAIGRGPSAEIQVVLALGTIAFVGVGVLIVERRPGNVVGPVLFVLGAYMAVYIVIEGLIRLPQPISIAPILGWFVSVSDGPGFGIVGLLVLVFPDGRLPSPRWRPVLWLVVLESLLIVVGVGLQSGPLTYYPEFDNPFGIPGFPGAGLSYAGYGVILAILVLAAASLVVRWRRATGVERAQLKWVAAAAALLAVSQVAVELSALGGATPAIGRASINEVAAFLSTAAFSSFPVAVGIAVLRYRLYEIDRIISRSLAYAALTAMLVAVYLAGFAIIQAALVPFTNSGGPVAVAASTLAVLVVFQPLRHRIQRAMDRRFNRSRYDADRIVATFSSHLRDEVEVGALRAELSTAIGRTVQPTSLTVWLRAPVGDGR
jgi:hypothetical protein